MVNNEDIVVIICWLLNEINKLKPVVPWSHVLRKEACKMACINTYL